MNVKEEAPLRARWPVLSARLARVEEAIIGLLMLAVTAVIFTNVIRRYFFDSSLSWAEEFSRYAVVWMTFLGASVCVYRGIHIVVDVWADRLGKVLDRSLLIIAHLICIGFCTAMLVLGVQVALKVMSLSQKTIALGIPMWWVYAAIPVGALLMGLRFTEKLVQLLSPGPQVSADAALKEPADD